MKNKRTFVTPEMAYPGTLPGALKAMGDYVYAYYRTGEYQPFYVGKGRRGRVLQHWKKAIDCPEKDHEKEIAAILRAGELPVIKLLAYNLEKTPRNQVYSVAERVLEDAFGIQRVWEKRPGGDRLVNAHGSTLLQIREDSGRTPVLSLDAVIAKAGKARVMSRDELSEMIGAPVLLVGLSKTYHPSYSESQLANMARMYWTLEDRYGNTRLPALKEHPSSVLLAWSSHLNKLPMIVGAWRIKHNSIKPESRYGREIMEVESEPDLELRRTCIGVRLPGTGNHWQGQTISIPG